MAPKHDQTTFAALKQHDKYYLNGGDLYFLIENHHFRVHRYFFERESEYFQCKLTVPASPGEAPVGTSQGNAIVLDDVRSIEFERFLWVFYNPKYSLYDTTLEEWTSILELAHRWKFAEVKNLVVRELEKLPISDIDKIVLYDKYDIDKNLLVPAYSALCMREAPLSLDEGLKLGIATALMVARARECARCKPTDSGERSPTPADLKEQDMHSIVKGLFGIAEPKSSSGGATAAVNGAASPKGTTSPAGVASPTGGSYEPTAQDPKVEGESPATLREGTPLATTPDMAAHPMAGEGRKNIKTGRVDHDASGENGEGHKDGVKTDDVNVFNDVGGIGHKVLDADARTAEEVTSTDGEAISGNPEAEGNAQWLGNHNTGDAEQKHNDGVADAVDIANPHVSEPMLITSGEVQDALKNAGAEIEKEGITDIGNLDETSTDSNREHGDNGIEGPDGQNRNDVGKDGINDEGNTVGTKPSTSNTGKDDQGNDKADAGQGNNYPGEANASGSQGGTTSETVVDEQGVKTNGGVGAMDELFMANNDQNAKNINVKEESKKEDDDTNNGVEPASEAGDGKGNGAMGMENREPQTTGEDNSTNAGLHSGKATDGSTENNPSPENDSSTTVGAGIQQQQGTPENGDARPWEVAGHNNEILSTTENAKGEDGGHSHGNGDGRMSLRTDLADLDDDDDEYFDSPEDLD